jgi:S1-C subfamily serine protease
MNHPSTSSAIVACLILTLASTAQAQNHRPTAIDLYGIGGHTQPIGVHHGYHIEMVKAGSAADADHLRPHDVIIKVDGESIRNIDHLRAVLAEAALNDGEVTITYTRGASIEHHVMKAHPRAEVVKPVGKKR